MVNPPSKNELQMYDLCFVKLERKTDTSIPVFMCTVKEHPTSNNLRTFTSYNVFGAQQEAIKWLSKNVRIN